MSDAPAEDRRSVIDGKCVRTSVSAMQKADGCLRQWYYRYVQGLPDKPPGKGQLRGIEGHKRIAEYLTTGKDGLLPLERLGVTQGLIPAPGRDLLVEHPFGEGMTAGDIPMVGFMDLVSYRDGKTQITDWKFKKDISQWGASEADLTDPKTDTGIQMLGYAAWAIQAAHLPGGADAIELRHVTFQTEGRADVLETKTIARDVIPRWRQIVARIAPKMIVAAAAPHAQEVPKNTSLCERFGGCAYRDTCLDRMAQITASFKKLNKKESNTMGLMTSTTPPVPPAPTPAVSAAPPPVVLTAKDAEQGKLYTVAGQQATFLCRVQTGGMSRASFIPLSGGAPLLTALDLVITPATETPPSVAPPETPKARRMTYVDTSAILPSDAPKSDPALAAKPLTIVDIPASAPAAPAPPVPSVPVVPQTAPQMMAALKESIAQVEAPKKRGRPLKAPSPEVAIAPAVSVALYSPEPPPTAAPDPGGFSLFFGCSPVGAATQTLNAYVEKLDRQFCAAAQLTCPDLRAVSTSDFGFGKWKGFLAKLALEQPPPPGLYVVTTGDERVEVVAEALMSKAALVVLGVGR